MQQNHTCFKGKALKFDFAKNVHQKYRNLSVQQLSQKNCKKLWLFFDMLLSNVNIDTL